jgi:hypothetical protein
MMKTLVTSSLVVLALGAPACASPKNEAASVLNAVDRYRRAENAQKPAQAAALESVQCSDPEVCDVKATCLQSAQATARALVLKAEIEKGVADIEAGRLSKEDPAAQALHGKWEESVRLLEEGHKLMPACDDKVLSLKRKYGL